MDVVYPVREGEHNDELMYSLRSLKNIPHGKVFLVGYAPSWVRNIVHIKRDQKGFTKYQNSTANLLAACNDPRVSDDFILMNDDFFFLKPMTEVPVRHRGPVKDVIEEYKQRYKADKKYLQGMIETYELCKAWFSNEPLSYELHIPMVINKEKFLDTWGAGKHIHPLHKRTLYGNMWQIGGEQMEDTKETFKRRDANTTEFLSTDERSFSFLGQHRRLMRKFPQKCEYEK
jgi:hypothetical protein